MGRKRKNEQPTEETRSTVQEETLPPIDPSTNGEANGQVEGKRPVQSFSLSAGNGVYIEASIWPKELVYDDKTIVVYSVTLHKNYSVDGVWKHSNFFRGSELHIVQHLLAKANAWILDSRCDEAVPF